MDELAVVNEDWAIHGAVVMQCLSHRVRILTAKLLCEGEFSGQALAEATGTSQARMSQHLKLFHAAKLSVRRREGTTIYFSVNPSHRGAVLTLIAIAQSVLNRA